MDQSFATATLAIHSAIDLAKMMVVLGGFFLSIFWIVHPEIGSRLRPISNRGSTMGGTVSMSRTSNQSKTMVQIAGFVLLGATIAYSGIIPISPREVLANRTQLLTTIFAVYYVGIVIGLWKVFEKVDEPGWYALIPVFNINVLLETINLQWWLLIILIVPYAGPLAWIFISIKLAKSFGKGLMYGLGIGLLPFIFLPLLGFGEAEFQGFDISENLCQIIQRKYNEGKTPNEIAHDLDLDYENVNYHIDGECEHSRVNT